MEESSTERVIGRKRQTEIYSRNFWRATKGSCQWDSPAIARLRKSIEPVCGKAIESQLQIAGKPLRYSTLVSRCRRIQELSMTDHRPRSVGSRFYRAQTLPPMADAGRSRPRAAARSTRLRINLNPPGQRRSCLINRISLLARNNLRDHPSREKDY
jgi:hypothetical protein